MNLLSGANLLQSVLDELDVTLLPSQQDDLEQALQELLDAGEDIATPMALADMLRVNPQILDALGAEDNLTSIVNDAVIELSKEVVEVANQTTYDATGDDFHFILDFNDSDVVTKVSTINGFGAGDLLTIENTPEGSVTLIEAVAAISDDLFYLREGVLGTDSWGLNMGGQSADLIADLEAAGDVADQLDVLGAQWGDWLTIEAA
jgi:hypothetical protein